MVLFDDVRKYVFPLMSADMKDGVLQTATLAFHGTGFFISPTGLALSAAHIIPSPETLGARKLFAFVQRATTEVFQVTNVQSWLQHDLCSIRVAIDKTEYFSCDFSGLDSGEDVWSVGIPEHELWEKGKKQMRTLKGHISFAMDRFVELSFHVPKGMSGSPLLVGKSVKGVLIGNWRSEQLEDRIEEIVEVSDKREIIRFIESKEIVHAGVAIDLANVDGLQKHLAK